MDAQVVDTAQGDLDGGALEARQAVAGHPEAAHHVGDGAQRLVGGDLQGGLEQVAVEDHVQVLVGGDRLPLTTAGDKGAMRVCRRQEVTAVVLFAG